MTIQRQDEGAVPSHSTIEIHSREFYCDGEFEGDHPRVYYETRMKISNSVDIVIPSMCMSGVDIGSIDLENIVEFLVRHDQ